MTDYFSEYASFVGAKGLPSPADTPYETPGFIRSKRSSRATAGSSREQSNSPPPLPPSTTDYNDGGRDGRYSALDPRRFTPTLHASLVAEILSLRRDLDSKNHLVEDLETSLSNTKTENETLAQQLSDSSREIRKAKTKLVQLEQETFAALEDLVRERDAAQHAADDVRSKLDIATKKARWQDEDVVRTQGIWETEKESWENERRQLERRIHVTENRLRAVVEEMTVHHAQMELRNAQVEEAANDSTFKDSGLGNESDTGSIRTSISPQKHRRNISSVSFNNKPMRNSGSVRITAGTPDLYAKQRAGQNSLADELGMDKEDGYYDDFENTDDEIEYAELKRRTMGSRQSLQGGDIDNKAKRVLGLASEVPAPTSADGARKPKPDGSVPEKPFSHAVSAWSPSRADHQEPSIAPRVGYVDAGYQPSPPPSPKSKGTSTEPVQVPVIREPEGDANLRETNGQTHLSRPAIDVNTSVQVSPISPPQTPVVDSETWANSEHMSIPAPTYNSAGTQTDTVEPARPVSPRSNRNSLSPPSFVPSIAIHPPSSRPSSPRPAVLPPGTKNAACQANLSVRSKDASVQTENIRVDKRSARLPLHLRPSQLLPSPNFRDERERAQKLEPPNQAKPMASSGITKLFTKIPPAVPLPSPPLQSPTDSVSGMSRDNSWKDLRNLPLKVIPLPKPVLSPTASQQETVGDGPLNRSSQYGVTRPLRGSAHLADIERDSDQSDYEDPVSDVEPKNLIGSIPAFSKAPQGRFGLSEPPKVVPEDKEISPERRPDTAGSYGAAPAPSVASSKANSQRNRVRPPPKINSYKDVRSRSPSFGSVASSSYSAQSTLPPPYPIPTRSSSRVVRKPLSSGSGSPTRSQGDRGSRPSHSRQTSLRKVQSAAVIRSKPVRTPPRKSGRSRRSPNLTPIQSMAFENPAPTKFPIPEVPTLPTPLQENLPYEFTKGSMDLTTRPETAGTLAPRTSQESDLVDAIAATMVGEWMWKYIRKQKPFGLGGDANDFAHTSTNGTVSITTNGTRHKRWVWLSPYERTIMWDSKQPASGNALLGKKGRKLTIQSVLDVQDKTPMPKGAELSSAFHRSILVLTPERALKFTCVTQERHVLWMTALLFLAQSGSLPSALSSLPCEGPPQQRVPLPAHEPAPIKRNRSPSFGRASIRDSVRLAKGKRPYLHTSKAQPVTASETAIEAEHEPQDSGADFPAVPRLYITTSRHQRKRSNTSPRLPAPLNTLRSASSTAVPLSSASLHPSTVAKSSFRTDVRSSSSKSGSRGDSITSPEGPNFFEAIGTVRMEAFVDPNVRDGVLYVPAPPPPPPAAIPRRRQRVGSNLSASTMDKRRAGYVFDENGFDPFKGF